MKITSAAGTFIFTTLILFSVISELGLAETVTLPVYYSGSSSIVKRGELVDCSDDSHLTVKVGLGTPSQQCDAQVDTTSSDLWVPSSEQSSSSAGFAFGSSKTFKKTQESWSSKVWGNSYSGNYCEDTVSLGDSISLSGYKFGVSNTECSSGVLGLGYSGSGLISTIGGKEGCSSIYAINYGEILKQACTGTETEVSSGITIGGYDKTQFTGDVHWCSFDDNFQFGDFGKVEFKNDCKSFLSLDLSSYKLTVDTTSAPTCQLPEALYAEFTAAFEFDAQYTEYVSCSKYKDTTISFEVNGETFSFGFLDLSWTYNQEALDLCKPRFTSSSSNTVVLGQFFLQNVYSIFDFEQKQIGFCHSSSSNSSDVCGSSSSITTEAFSTGQSTATTPVVNTPTTDCETNTHQHTHPTGPPNGFTTGGTTFTVNTPTTDCETNTHQHTHPTGPPNGFTTGGTTFTINTPTTDCETNTHQHTHPTGPPSGFTTGGTTFTVNTPTTDCETNTHQHTHPTGPPNGFTTGGTTFTINTPTTDCETNTHQHTQPTGPPNGFTTGTTTVAESSSTETFPTAPTTTSVESTVSTQFTPITFSTGFSSTEYTASSESSTNSESTAYSSVSSTPETSATVSTRVTTTPVTSSTLATTGTTASLSSSSSAGSTSGSSSTDTTPVTKVTFSTGASTSSLSSSSSAESTSGSSSTDTTPVTIVTFSTGASTSSTVDTTHLTSARTSSSPIKAQSSSASSTPAISFSSTESTTSSAEVTSSTVTSSSSGDITESTTTPVTPVTFDTQSTAESTRSSAASDSSSIASTTGHVASASVTSSPITPVTSISESTEYTFVTSSSSGEIIYSTSSTEYSSGTIVTFATVSSSEETVISSSVFTPTVKAGSKTLSVSITPVTSATSTQYTVITTTIGGTVGTTITVPCDQSGKPSYDDSSLISYTTANQVEGKSTKIITLPWTPTTSATSYTVITTTIEGAVETTVTVPCDISGKPSFLSSLVSYTTFVRVEGTVTDIITVPCESGAVSTAGVTTETESEHSKETTVLSTSSVNSVAALVSVTSAGPAEDVSSTMYIYETIYVTSGTDSSKVLTVSTSAIVVPASTSNAATLTSSISSSSSSANSTPAVSTLYGSGASSNKLYGGSWFRKYATLSLLLVGAIIVA